MLFTLRRFVERCTRSWIFPRALPAEFNGARIYVSPSAGLKFLFRPMKDADPDLLRSAMIVKPGDVVWDVGANIGMFAVAASARAGSKGRVFAFEPDTWLVRLLRRTSALQPDTQAPISVVPVAVASGVSIRSFSIAARSRASNALSEYGRSQAGGVAEQHLVPAFNLDWLATQFPTPDVLKIDVEGAEIEVLKGQNELLNRLRPLIVCEVSSEASSEVTAILHAARYRLYDGDKPIRRDQPSGAASWSTVAVPEEKLHLLSD